MPLDRRAFLVSTLAASAAALAEPFASAFAKAPQSGRQTAGFYRFKVGAFEVSAINDGFLNLGLAVYSGGEKPEGERLLNAAFLPADKIPTSVNAYLVNTGERLVLIDSGTSTAMGATLGRVAANLAAAGIDPTAVDALLLTHMHPDHSNGAITPAGVAAFPNAELVVAEAEHRFWHDDGFLARAPQDFKPFFQAARAVAKAYAGRLRLIQPGGDVLPGLTSLAAPGHTPGHAMYRVSSGNESLLVWGDIVHTAALQFPQPDWTIGFDNDPALAKETRKKVFDQVSADRTLVAGMHLNFPGIGNVAKDGAGYRFAPAFWAPEL